MITKKDLDKYIFEKTRNAKRVLAIGETNMNFEERYAHNLSDWRFAKLAKINKNIVGIDYVQENITAAKKTGYDFRCVDIEKSNQTKKLGKFDLIIMLDVIEHLSNVGIAMENLRDILTADGEIILCTDSPFYFRQIFNKLFRLKIEIHEDHTGFIVPEHMKQICKRAGLKLVRVDSAHFVKTKWWNAWFSYFLKAIHYSFVDQFVYVVKK